MVTLTLLPLVLALATPLLVVACGRRWPRTAAPLATAGAGAVAAALAWGLAAGGGAVDFSWLPAWGWRLHLALDPLAGLYALLAAGVALPVLAYAAAYVPHHLLEQGAPLRRLATFYGWMSLFLASMVGLAMAADLVLLFVFFDLTALCSWALIAFDREEPEARSAALTALLVTGVTSVGFLAGVVLLGARHGTLQIDELIRRAGESGGDPAITAAMVLVLVAALAKSAQVPLHFWLPRAMVAPTPVSAYLHSAAMVAAGMLVLHRLHPLLPPAVATALAAVGWLSIATGGLLALAATELKRILAYSTIAHYGHVAVILGLGGAKGAAVAAVYVVAHGLAKSALFLTAGAVTRATGEKDLERVGGLGRRLPLLAGATAVAGAGLAGLPATAGFWKDEGFFQVLEETGGLAMLGGVAALTLTVAYSWRFWAGIFLDGPGLGRPASESNVPKLLVLPVAALALALLAGGFDGSPLAHAGRAVARAVHGHGELDLAYHLDLRPTHVMALSGWLLGALLAASRGAWQGVLGALADRGGRLGPARLWDVGLAGLNRLSHRLHVLEIRDLRDRLAAILLPAGILVAVALIIGHRAAGYELGRAISGQVPLVLALGASTVAAVVAVVVRSHLGMVLALTGVGFSLAAVFALLGAPDVALVAVLVETALTLLFVVALAALPSDRLEQEERRGRPRHRTRWHTAAAVLTGVLVFAVSWAGLSNPAADAVTHSFVDLAEAAHAKNVLAAILVDFRGLDTLGEVTVLVVVLLGVVALLEHRSTG